MDTQTLWKTVLADLQLQVTQGVFQTFLARTQLVSLTDTQAIIGCSQPMHITYLEKRYGEMIQKTLYAHSKKNAAILFTVTTQRLTTHLDGPLFSTPDSSTGPEQIGQYISPQSRSMPSQSRPAQASARVSDSLPRPFPTSARLNPDYTFENFAVSSSNQMAYAAATAVAKAPGTSYNPLFLYGGVGVGKTHLMQAVGAYVLALKPRAKLLYCTSEEFTNEIIEAIQTKTATSFKKRFRQVDLLLIDDVQFIAGKNTAQEEFFHTFNAIHQAQGQIIMTSDRPPDEMTKLEDRLRSRFEGGLIIDIGPPDFELRTAIILIKAQHRGIDLPIDAAKILAQTVDNPRKLEGVLIRVLTESQLNNVPISTELVLSILGKSMKETASIPTPVHPDKVITTLASYYNLKVSQLKGTRRDTFLSLPRQILYYLLHVEFKLPLMSVGDLLGGRDHTTILHGVRKITTLLSTNEKIRGDIVGIKAKIVG